MGRCIGRCESQVTGVGRSTLRTATGKVVNDRFWGGGGSESVGPSDRHYDCSRLIL